MIKDTDKPSDEDVHRVRTKRVPDTGASVPLELGCATLPAHGHAHQPGSSLKPEVWGILWRLHHTGMMDHHLSPPRLTPSWRMGVGLEVSSF